MKQKKCLKITLNNYKKDLYTYIIFKMNADRYGEKLKDQRKEVEKYINNLGIRFFFSLGISFKKYQTCLIFYIDTFNKKNFYSID